MVNSNKKVPLVSVCIANYNGEQIISDCINSVLIQSVASPIEIIVHDDASTDGSVDLIRHNYPQIKLITTNQNVGFCISNNRMAAVANGEYLLLLNNDATLLPDAIATLIDNAKKLAHPTILSLPQYEATSGKLLDIGCVFDPFLNPVPNLDPNRGEVGMVMGACLWVPKRLWQSLGGFPEWFGSIGEDLYLCCRARLIHCPIIALPNSGYRHHVGKSFGGGKIQESKLVTTRKRRALSERNKSFTLVMVYPAPLLIVVLPLHIILLIFEGALLTCVLREWNLFQSIYWQTLSALWQERRKLLDARREIQKHRQISLKNFLRVFRFTPYKLSMLIRYGLPKIT